MEKSEKSEKSHDYFEAVLHLEDIYNTANDSLERVHIPRYDDFTKRFEKIYNEKPAFLIRAPGRVNIIGEHIDYMDYGVLPMAIEQDTLIGFVPTTEPVIELNHTQPALFPAEKLSNDPTQKFKEASHYTNYFLAGYKAALIDSGKKEFVGMKVLLSGNVPVAAGLSSSSSFCVAVTLLTLFANDLHNKKKKAEYVDSIIKYERICAIAGGGMDQTISALGESGKAFFIEFNPIRTTPVVLPKGFSFVVANSLTPSPKLLTLGTRYNKRVVECVFAIEILRSKLNIKDETKLLTLRALQEFLGYSFEDMMNLVKEHLERKAYTVADLEAILGSPLMKKVSRIANADLVLNSNTEFFPYQRAIHVFTEAERVIKFRDTCEQLNQPDAKHNEIAVKLGQLMDASHTSCRDLYDCSSPELDKLTDLCRKNGALGSRLTGAGWGGCCVSLVLQSEAQAFIEKLQTEYYLNKENNLMITDDLDMYVFATAPGRGAVVLDPKYEIWY